MNFLTVVGKVEFIRREKNFRKVANNSCFAGKHQPGSHLQELLIGIDRPLDCAVLY